MTAGSPCATTATSRTLSTACSKSRSASSGGAIRTGKTSTRTVPTTRTSWQARPRLTTDRRQQKVGRIGGQESGQQAPREVGRGADPPAEVEQLVQNVEQGAGGHGEESHREVARARKVSDPGAEKRGPAPDQARHARERFALPVEEGRLHRIAGVGEDVPEQKDQDPGREGVEEALDRLGQAVHAGDRKAQKNGSSSDGAQ